MLRMLRAVKQKPVLANPSLTSDMNGELNYTTLGTFLS